jgi:hypothetical protein
MRVKEGLWLLIALLLIGVVDVYAFGDGPAEEITPSRST